MSRVVCNICGTSYAAADDKCPICGYAKNGENVKSAPKTKVIEEVNTESEVAVSAASHSYVKGGRYSKANVKKRNQGRAPAGGYSSGSSSNKKKSSNVGAIIIIVVLMLAILCVLGYIALRFFIPNDFLYEGFNGMGTEQQVEEQQGPVTEPEDTQPSLACTAVRLGSTEIHLEDIGSTQKLNVSLDPADTIDQVIYSSSDDSVATVTADGVVTSVGEGTATITVTCGPATAQCTVICTIPEPEFELTLNRKEITFTEAEQTWLLYDGEIPAEEIVWISDDSSVATIENGNVIAVGEGDTFVYGIYSEQSVSCEIHCIFEAEPEEETGNVSEAEGDSDKTYSLYNPYNPRNASDVTIGVGEKFNLMLVDENKEEAPNVQWSVTDESVCSVKDGFITGLKGGMVEVTATCNGKTYTCIVRVA